LHKPICSCSVLPQSPPEPQTLDQHCTATPDPDADDAEIARLPANLSLDRVYQRLGVSPQKLRLLMPFDASEAA